MKVVTVEQSREWDRFVSDCPDAAYGHLFGWRRIIEKAYGHKSLYLAAVGNNEIHAVLPLVRIKRPFFCPEWVSMPFFDQAGILARDHNAEKRLLEKAGDMLKKRGAGRLSLRQDCRFNAGDVEVGGQLPERFDEKVGMMIALASNRQAMMKGFRSKLRSQIKKGKKNGLTWDIGKARLLDPFFRVFSRNMRDLGSPVHSKKFFAAILNRFPSSAFICAVYHQGRPAAAAFMFRFKNRLANPWASSLREYRHLNTNMFLYWQMIGFACNLGLELFDMGRSSRGASTHKFKLQWGPAQIPLAWYTWKFNEGGTVNETLSIAPWKRMPVCAANLAGPFIRKYISL